MKRQLTLLLLIFIFSNIFGQEIQIEFEDEIDEIFTRMELRGIDTDTELLYGYFFYCKNEKNIKQLKEVLQNDGFKFIAAEPMEDKITVSLHMEKIEKLTREDLRTKELFLHKTADQYKVDYDGWDVGNINPAEPLTSPDIFVEYLKKLPAQKLFEDSKIFYQLQDYQSALIGFDISIQREIKIDTCTFYLGCCLSKLGDNENGIRLLKEVVEKYPMFERAAYNVAAISYEIQNFDDTILYYEKVIQLNPKNDQAYYGMAAAEYGKKNFAKTKEYCNKALEINPENKLAKDLLGWLK